MSAHPLTLTSRPGGSCLCASSGFALQVSDVLGISCLTMPSRPSKPSLSFSFLPSLGLRFSLKWRRGPAQPLVHDSALQHPIGWTDAQLQSLCSKWYSNQNQGGLCTMLTRLQRPLWKTGIPFSELCSLQGFPTSGIPRWRLSEYLL